MSLAVLEALSILKYEDLVGWLEAGCRAPKQFRIGTEHEKIPFYSEDYSPVPYIGGVTEKKTRHIDIQSLLQILQKKLSWDPLLESSTLIGLRDPKSGQTISLEPGGQLELSGAPLLSVHETQKELCEHLKVLQDHVQPLGICFLGMGLSPKWSLAETPIMPKRRYKIMSQYMPQVGTRGLDMMFQTATTQVNLDFSSEADMVQKLRLSLALQPLTTALFANSPFSEGQPTGFLSTRSEIWQHTDPNRTGLLPFAFEKGMSFERYVDYALDVPMYFVKRGGQHYNAAGASFRDFLKGKLTHIPFGSPQLSDWVDHLSTIFPEVRLRNYLEMRGADTGNAAHICALPALFVGLLYDSVAQDMAWEMIKDWNLEERERLRTSVPAQGLRAQIKNRPLQDWGKDILKIAREGLRRRNILDEENRDETHFLAPLDVILQEGRSAAEILLDHFQHRWGGSILPVFQEAHY